MPEEIFLQHWIFTRFGLPFLLVFFVTFAILEKTKVFGDKKSQLNAIISFVLGLIVIGVAYPTTVISNMVLFLTVAIIVVFVVLLLWSFLHLGGEIKLPDNKTFRIVLFIVLSIIVFVAVLWATGWSEGFLNFFSSSTWGENNLLGNILFIVVIVVALAVVLAGSKANRS